jgi:hypothetical protein
MTTDTDNGTNEDGMDLDAWLAIRKREGGRIDPSNVEMLWLHTQIIDPYGVYGEPPPECWGVGRTYFFRNIGSEIWVASTDIPKETMEKLWARIDNSDLTENDDLPF